MTALSDGEALAHYRIRARLGEGGMGEVYLADDERLDRPVALKVLKTRDSLDQFVQEARAASALNHPNVAHIYEIGQRGDTVYIAMEYVAGVTLETRLARGPLPLSEALSIAVQLADALVEAHAIGIVHRDLKPANIVVDGRGRAKILDFGIAVRRTGFGSPTGAAKTDPAFVVGTVPYMSPEQARGEPVDHRSDQFAFGVILYEMLAGRRPFDGESVADTFLRITSAPHPPLDAPEAVGRIVDRCLEKDRERRWSSPARLLAALRALQERRAPRTRSRLIGLGLLLTAMSVLIATLVMRQRSAPEPRLTKITSAPGLEDEPSLSPDGQSIAYTSDERGNLDVFVRRIGGGEVLRITDSDADDAQPAWSPDGTRIAYVSARDRGGRLSIVLGQALANFVNARGGDLFITPARGGAPRKLAAEAYYPAWSPDGEWIVFQSNRGGRWDLWKIRARGGAPPMQLTNDADFDYQPSFSPDGKWIVYGSGMPAPYRVKIVRATGGKPRPITDGKDTMLIEPVFSADGRSIIYSSARGGSVNLWRTRLSGGAPERLTLGEGDDVSASAGADAKRIAYATVRHTPDLWTVDVASGKAQQLTFDTGREEFPDRSATGALVFSSDRGGSDALWLRHPDGTLTQFVARTAAGQARWSPDGTRIAYRFTRADGHTVTAVQERGSATPRIIAAAAEAPAWSPDGKWIAVTSWEKHRKAQIFVLSGSDPRQRRQITALDLITSYPTWSPDGRFIAFQATRDDGTRHIWIASVATGAARPLTSGLSEDSHPNWSPTDPDRILFVRNHENLMTVRVSTGEVEPLTRYSEPNMVLDYPSWSRDGRSVDFSIARKRGDLYLLEQ